MSDDWTVAKESKVNKNPEEIVDIEESAEDPNENYFN